MLGLQVFALGLLGELIIFTHAREMKDYQVDRIIEYPKTDVTQLPAPPAAREERGEAARPLAL